MIILKTLTWSNAFSYGLDNKLDFSKNQLTQLIGKNGHGKSSIALILEEVLYNKNSKGIKKADILNRYVKDKTYTIELEFAKDQDIYKIETRRGSTQQVKLFKNCKDISSHTATNTYKIIEKLIGLDHKTFTQIVYQSHAGSLEFLTSADTARKKFLIELLNLNKYTKAGEVFKKLKDELSVELEVLTGKTNTICDWLERYKNTDLTKKSLISVSKLPEDLIAQQDAIHKDLSNIETTNKKITQNNLYKQLRDKIEVTAIPEKPEESSEGYIKLAASAQQKHQSAKQFFDKLKKLTGVCPTCFSNIDTLKTQQLAEEQQAIMLEANKQAELANKKAEAIKTQLSSWQKAVKATEEWEKYYNLVDTNLPEVCLDEQTLKQKLTDIQTTITTIKQEISQIDKANKLNTEHNSRVDLIKSQLLEMNEELKLVQEKAGELTSRLNIFNILVKTFSTTGLVAYKIENLVKDLELITNEYLAELSNGRFQIGFEIAGNDKLNVVIHDNGINIDIQALSGGEKARVNVASLLAIRKLMQSLSNSRINLLILDETVEALDVDGKEKLIEVLLKEESLNTLLVSHGFTHPLLEKLHVQKTKNISRLED